MVRPRTPIDNNEFEVRKGWFAAACPILLLNKRKKDVFAAAFPSHTFYLIPHHLISWSSVDGSKDGGS